MIDVVKEKETTLSSAYEIGLKLLNDSYKEGKIFSSLPKAGDPLSDLELLSVLALAPVTRKEILNKYLYHSKIFSLATTGIMAWVAVNAIDEFSEDEKVGLEKYFSVCEEYFDKKINTDGLLPTDSDGNWMQSADRGGALIESQAYYAKILGVLSLLTDDDMYEFKKKRLTRAIRDKLDGAYVLDKEDSMEVRPNNFIAAFLAPELFKKDDWRKTFDVALKKSELWMSWGGLTTLGQSDTNYNPECDGESWFFINNIAAVVLYRLDKEKYADKVQAILKSSAENASWQEHSGRPCEVTLTADRQIKVQGLYGLSLATFIYLYRIFKS